MELFSSSWRSLANSIDKLIDFLASRLQILHQKKWGRFLVGSFIGTFLVAIYWSYAVFFQVDIPLPQAIIGSLLCMVVFGVVGIYGKLEKLLDNLSDVQL